MTPTPAPAATARPATVTTASALQIALAGTLLVIVGLAVADAVHYDTLIDQAARSTGAAADEVAAERSSNLFSTLAVALPLLLLAGWFAGTARWLRRGSNVARIMALVGLGAPLLLGVLACLVGGLGALLVAGTLAASDWADDPTEVTGDDEPVSDGAFYDQVWQLDSGTWSAVSGAVTLTATVLALILGVSTVVLLLTGPSSRWFRPHRATSAVPPPWPASGPAPYPPVPYPPVHYAPTPFGPAPYQPPAYGPSPWGPPPPGPAPFTPPPAGPPEAGPPPAGPTQAGPTQAGPPNDEPPNNGPQQDGPAAEGPAEQRPASDGGAAVS